MLSGDASLKKGTEVISPILTGNNVKTSNAIKNVCKKLNSLEQVASENCGGHIHIGSKYLTSAQSWRNLIEIWGNCEIIFYIISNKAGEIPREKVVKYAGPNSGNFEENLNKGNVQLDNIEDLRAFAKNAQKYERFFAINFLNLGNDKDTIEFRLSNGTINADTWIENINLFGGLIRVSEELAQIQQRTEQEPTNKEKRWLECFEELKNNALPQEKLLEDLLEIIVSEEDREIYRKRYEVNSKLIEESPEIKSSITDKMAKERLTVKKVVKKIFSGDDKVTGQEYEENDIIIQRDLQNTRNVMEIE